MPNGNLHALSSALLGGVGCSLLALSFGQPGPIAAAFATGCLIGVVINPDLDVRTGSHAYEVLRATGGKLFGSPLSKAWRWFWWPYARLIPRHRHPFSHLPILGTVLRLGYLLALPTLVWWVLGFFVRLPDLPRLPHTPLISWGVLGLLLSDTLHTLMDWFWPWQ